MSDKQDWNEVDRSAAIMMKVTSNPRQFTGDRYQDARKSLKDSILRAVDTHLVPGTIDRLHNYGQVTWKDGVLALDTVKVKEWLDQVLERIHEAPKRVQRQINALHELMLQAAPA